jgi:hypothetical protein
MQPRSELTRSKEPSALAKFAVKFLTLLTDT